MSASPTRYYVIWGTGYEKQIDLGNIIVYYYILWYMPLLVDISAY